MAITHGNGQQVGNILLQNEIEKETLPPMPLDVCGAESQGMIGYMLQRALRSELESAGQQIPVTTIVSQTLVDPKDPAFKNPTKPVGPFYTEKEARRLQESKGWHIISDSGRGYRRLVPSPTPLDILERETCGHRFSGKGRRGPQRDCRDDNYEPVRRSTANFRSEK